MYSLYSFLEIIVVLYMLVKIIIGFGLAASSDYPSSRLKSNVGNGGIQTFLTLVVIYLLDKNIPDSPGLSMVLLLVTSLFINKFEPLKSY